MPAGWSAPAGQVVGVAEMVEVTDKAGVRQSVGHPVSREVTSLVIDPELPVAPVEEAGVWPAVVGSGDGYLGPEAFSDFHDPTLRGSGVGHAA